MNLVILGNVCIDRNRINNVSYEAAGGPITFISLFFSEIKDVSLTSIASYGDDFLPFKNSLNLYPLKPNLKDSLVYENIIVNGKRRQKSHLYKEAISPEIDEGLIKIIKDADVLFFTPLIPYFSPEYVKNIVNLTSKNCLKIFLPQGYFREFDKDDNVIFREFKEADELLPFFDFAILSSEDYPDIENLSFEWSKKYNNTFIITTAEKGAVIVNKNGRVEASTSPIRLEEIVDSVGAGEFFTGGFAYNYFKNKNLEESVKLANQAAREKLLTKKIKEN